jgi:hypothetical protein
MLVSLERSNLGKRLRPILVISVKTHSVVNYSSVQITHTDKTENERGLSCLILRKDHVYQSSGTIIAMTKTCQETALNVAQSNHVQIKQEFCIIQGSPQHKLRSPPIQPPTHTHTVLVHLISERA